MATVLKQDLKFNTSITEDKDGYRVERTALIILDSGTAESALFRSISDAALPNIGDVHPSISTIYLNSISCDPVGTDTYRVTLNYSDEHGFPLVANVAKSASAVTVAEATQKDALGTPMLAVYTTIQNNIDSDYTTEYFTANVEKPQTSYTFEYTVAGPDFPKSTIDTYLGHVNTTTWNGYAVESVLCSNVEVTQQGQGYRVSISFTYNVSGWAFNAVIAVPMTEIASVGTDVDSTTGVKVFPFIYPIAEFNDLGLTI